MELTDFTFIFLFLPVFLISYFIVSHKGKLILIFVGSCVFYFWAEPIYFWILLVQIFFNFLFGLLIGNFSASKTMSRVLFLLSLSVNLFILISLKDSSYLLHALGITGPPPRIFESFIFPVGISFITFTSVSYLLDVTKGAIPPTRKLLSFANYILFFPKIQQGPIQDFQNFEKQLFSPTITISNAYRGISRFIQGLSKKVLIADSLAPVAESVFTSNLNEVGLGLSWYALAAFALQIYFDFSGYTDMAIGVSTILGVELPENFNSPYACTSIADFWRRWHMTLTGWFRKYIFYPLEFRFRNLGNFRQPLNLLIVFFITGLWHGIRPNYVVWGSYFGLFLAAESMGLGRLLKKLPGIMQHVYALFIVLLGWVFFRLKTPSNWPIFFRALFGLNGMSGNITARTLNILGYLPLLFIAIILCIPLPEIDGLQHNKVYQGLSVIFKIGIFLLSIAFLVEGGYQSFIYQQF